MLDPQYIPYCTVALLCSVALVHFCANIRRYAQNNAANRFFRTAILASAVCAMMEFCFGFHESGLITNLVYCYVTEVCYSTASLISGFCWFMSSELDQEDITVRTRHSRILCAVPIAVMALAVITTPLTHIVFYFTEDGHYVRGLLNNPLVYVTAVYIAKSGFFALGRSFQHKNYLKRGLYRSYFYYALAILIAQLLQILLGSVLPFRIVGAVVVFFWVQEKTIKQNVYMDLVSGANNRTSMENYLKLHFDSADERFAFVMVDLDDFKLVNDRYGHSTGDRTLALVSDAFNAALPEALFFARYGGDEFVIIGKLGSPDTMTRIAGEVRSRLQELSARDQLPLCPDFSYGIAYKTPDIHSIPDLINRADAAMYRYKKQHKAVPA